MFEFEGFYLQSKCKLLQNSFVKIYLFSDLLFAVAFRCKLIMLPKVLN